MEEVKVRLANFMDEHKHDIEFIGPQNGKIKEVLALINNTKPNKNNFFVIDGIWAHAKALNNNLCSNWNIDSSCRDRLSLQENAVVTLLS